MSWLEILSLLPFALLLFTIILSILVKIIQVKLKSRKAEKDTHALKQYTGTAYFKDRTEEFEIFAFSSDEAFDIIEKKSGRARRVDMQQHKL